MSPESQNLIWIDLEMTGLNPDTDQIIEIATIVTDATLNVLAEGPELAINQPDTLLESMDEWNTSHHRSSGLTERVRASSLDEADAERLTLEFLQSYVSSGISPMCGNSICQDRRFLHRCMPRLERYFHYRNLDVSTIKELCVRWTPHIAFALDKSATHRALQDIRDSITELRFYREHFFQLE